MKIVRENDAGYRIEVELTDDELKKAHYEYESKVMRQEMQDVADSKGLKLPDNFPFDDVESEIRHLRSKDECYMDGYWGAIGTAIIEELERMETK